MSVVVSNIKTALNQPVEDAITLGRKVLGLSESSIIESHIIKTSLDARRRDNIHFIHSVAYRLSCKEQELVDRLAEKNVTFREETDLTIQLGKKTLKNRPIIAGFGPAGMFAAYLLAQYGYRPLVLERGSDMDSRVEAVNRFWKKGELNPASNVQFGEGGAGTFSDGKLTTRIHDPRCDYVLKKLASLGAPQEICWKAKPHIGTDRLRDVVKNLRSEVIRLGGEVRFGQTLEGITYQSGRLQSISVGGTELPAQVLVLAIGHSARDTFEMLLYQGIAMEAKAFSVGVRIEHLQTEIDRMLYGRLAGHPALPKGEYQLSYRQGERGVYTFCMCPGGLVVPSASEEGTVVTNGMSEYARDRKNANSAVVVSVGPDDFGRLPMDGILFQHQLEQRAFLAGGSNYSAPAQTVGRFLNKQGGVSLGQVQPSYALGISETNFWNLLPTQVNDMLEKGLNQFNRKMCGFAAEDVLLTGVETRTSSPVRIIRNDSFESISVSGIYPCGEGAGYAGGIMSAAVDGIRVAQAIMQRYAPLH